VGTADVKTSVVDDLTAMLETEFGKEMPLSKSRGKKHDHLGMMLDCAQPGEVTVDMIDCIKSMIAEMPDEMIGAAVTPAASHLFKVNDNPELLEKDKAETFHRMVMQIQCLSQRARPDTRTAVSFLCKRTNNPDMDDWKKLTRVMRHLQHTLDLKLRLSSDGSGLVRWWVDASFAVHIDMRGHTGGTMSLGKGSVCSTSSAQKLVTRSSTECELVGAHDVLPQAIWTTRFLEGQGQRVDSVMFQDNMSTMHLEKNGRASSSKRTRHIALRHFFIKDCVDHGEIVIEHCPTEEMLADCFTKPLQGQLFCRLRDLIMNIDPSSPHHSVNRSVLSAKDPSPAHIGSLERSFKQALLGQ